MRHTYASGGQPTFSLFELHRIGALIVRHAAKLKLCCVATASVSVHLLLVYLERMYMSSIVHRSFSGALIQFQIQSIMS